MIRLRAAALAVAAAMPLRQRQVVLAACLRAAGAAVDCHLTWDWPPSSLCNIPAAAGLLGAEGEEEEAGMAAQAGSEDSTATSTLVDSRMGSTLTAISRHSIMSQRQRRVGIR